MPFQHGSPDRREVRALTSALITFPHELFNVVGHSDLLENCWSNLERSYVLGRAALIEINFTKFPLRMHHALYVGQKPSGLRIKWKTTSWATCTVTPETLRHALCMNQHRKLTLGTACHLTDLLTQYKNEVGS
jgi:hypothetical protein